MKDTVRVSFDMPMKEHIRIKTECVKSRIAMKDFLHELVLIGLEQVHKIKLKEDLQESIQQAKEGKVTTMTFDELEHFVDDDQSKL